MKIILEKEDVLKLIHNALCNGGLLELASSGVELIVESKQYNESRERLNKKMTNLICREDVWLEIFIKEGLKFVDEEGGEDLDVLTVDTALSNIQESIDTDLTNERINYIMDSLKEDGGEDAFTHWYILQMALYKDIIFG